MTRENSKANIVVIGAGWWSQGWHLPQLHRNENVNILAIVDRSPAPTSPLNPNLETCDALSKRYNVPIYESLEALLADTDLASQMDGAIVCAPHSTHYQLGVLLLREGIRRKQNDQPGISILMEKPMTTNVHEAKLLHELVQEYLAISTGTDSGCFLVNHSANYSLQIRKARRIVESGQIGAIRHVSAFFASPLMWLFDDPANTGWNEPTGDMVGNGFAWGQSSHLLAWIYHVCGSGGDDSSTCITPTKAYCINNHSDKTGADVSHAATISCSNNVTFSLSGTTLLPGHAHSDPPVGKQVRIEIFGSNGALLYSGDDRDVKSGRLELRDGSTGATTVVADTFQFEDCEQKGLGPASLLTFIDSCLGKKDIYIGADSGIGMKTVQTIDAMYRSHASGTAEDILY